MSSAPSDKIPVQMDSTHVDPDDPTKTDTGQIEVKADPDSPFLKDASGSASAANSSNSGFFGSFQSFLTSSTTKKGGKKKKEKSASLPPDERSHSSLPSLSTPRPENASSRSSIDKDSSDEGGQHSDASCSGPSDTEGLKNLDKNGLPLEPGDLKVEQERHFKHKRAKAVCTDKSLEKHKRKPRSKSETRDGSDSSTSASESHSVKRKKHGGYRKSSPSPKIGPANKRQSRTNSETQSDFPEEPNGVKKDEEKKREMEPAEGVNIPPFQPVVRKRGRPRLHGNQNMLSGKRGRGRPRKCWENQIRGGLKDKNLSVKYRKAYARRLMNVGDARMVSQERFTGKRGRGRPRKCWENQIHGGLKDKNISVKYRKAYARRLMNVGDAHMVSQEYCMRKSRPFLQNANCLEVAPKLAKCRECRIAAYNKNKKMQNSYCRFLAYRKLCYSKIGSVLNFGFSLPIDATKEHLKIWLPPSDSPPPDLNVETSKALLGQVGDQFCDLVEQEKEALSLHIGKDQTTTWKRIVQGVREMCDVCDTTLFNIHWVCHKCGLAVCIDCYKGRKQGIPREDDENSTKDRDEYQWLLCTGRQPHEIENLVLTQIVAGSAIWDMAKTMHHIRQVWNIPAYCKCMPRDESNVNSKNYSNGICKQLMSSVSKCFSSDRALYNKDTEQYVKKSSGAVTNGITSLMKNSPDFSELKSEVNANALHWLTETALRNSDNGESEDYWPQPNCNSYNKNNDFSSLQEMLLPPSELKENGSFSSEKSLSSSIDDVINCLIEQELGKDKTEESKMKYFSRRYPQPRSGRDPLPIRICTLAESTILHPDVPHSWLCSGRLLLLHEPHNPNNIKLFQEQWKRGQPILVANVSERLDMSLWHPDGFCRDFGQKVNDLVNCKTGAILQDMPMRKFWEGFENFSKRMKDEHGEYMLLKLKDWPPGDDFSEMLPKRFEDLMRGLPLPEYTHRNGILNLAGRLPACFVRPDLGPKMYNAYGSALYPAKGTTNLHLDISDAVNVMVYVGIPHDGKDEDHIQEALKAIDEGGCDALMRMRVRERGVRPGALWHIYNARDADKIRDLLNKVAIEKGEKLEAHHDPIHDQSWYVDETLRERLYQEYGVEGYAIAQCLGDAVFIPAGAPHQVRNLHSCVKVAEDFVSPENIAHCFKLTQEFRNLSDTHSNHEDKLQIKNIIYHVVRDALAHLIAATPESILKR